MDLTLFFTEGASLQTWQDTGTLQRELALYKRLAEQDVEVSLVTYGGGDESRLLGSSKMRVLSNEHNLPLNWYKKILTSFPPHGSVFKSNQVLGAQTAMQAARRASAKFIARCGYLLSMNEANSKGKNSQEAQHARNLEAHIFLGADRVVVTTELMSEEVQSNYGIHRNKITVIPNYVETERFTLKTDFDAKGKAKIGIVGRLAPEKNLSMLFEACSGLDAQLAIVGNGPLRSELETLARKFKLDITFLGRIDNDELPELLRSWDLFAAPSFYEGHPKALIEAMASGLPVVGANVRGIREIIQDGVNGLITELNVENLRGKIRQALDDIELRKRLGNAASAFVQANFSLDRVVNLEMDMLRNLTA